MKDTHPLRVFIVEDEDRVAREIKDLLCALDYTVCGTVARGEDFLRKFEVARPDVVLLNTCLGGALDGLQTAARLQDTSDVAVVMLADSWDDKLIQSATELGVAGFLVKPVRQQALHVVIRAACTKAQLEESLLRSNALLKQQRAFGQDTLDAMSARVGVLGASGDVLATNEAWKRFATVSGAGWESTVVGQNYLDACDEAFGDCAREAPLVASCLRKVLEGGDLQSTVEYPCQTPEGERWYLCNVTRFVADGPAKVVVQHDDVTAVHETRASLAAQERVFEALAISSPVGIYCMDSAGQCEYFNDRAYEITGLAPGEALGVGWVTAVHPEDRERILAARTLVLSGALPLHIELRFLHPNGSVSWALVQSERILDEAGRVTGYVGTMTEISERKLAEMTTAAISTQLISLQGDAFYEAALASLCDMLGTELAVVGRADSRCPAGMELITAFKDGVFIPSWNCPSDIQPCNRVLGGVSELIAAGVSQMYPENPFLAEVRAESYCGEPLIDDTGRVLGVLAVASRRAFRDPQLVVRTLKLFSVAFAAAMSRERAEKRFEAVLEFAPSGLVMIDPQGTVVIMNREAERIFGWDRNEVIGQLVEMLIPSQFRAGHVALRQAFAEREEKSQVALNRPRVTGLRKDGSEFPMDLSLSPIDTPDGLLLAAAIVDVTSRQALERKVAYGQKMEAIGELAGGIAHDFNNLLTAINGFSYMLSSKLAEESKEGAMVRQIARAGERAASLTRELLTFSRRQVDQPRIVNLNDVVTGSETMLRFLLGEDIGLELQLDSAMATVLVDPAQLEQVIVNLALNARDAMRGEGGVLSICTKIVVLEDTPETHESLPAGLKPGHHLLLEVSDNGIGIEENVIQHVFEPFFTTRGRANGTGLGLAVVYGIIKQSRGAIEVKSVVGEGSTFAVYLPVTESIPSSVEVLTPHPPARCAQETVLVVDDESAVRSLTRAVLEGAGYSVLLAETGEQAIDMLDQSPSPVDVLLTDVILPGISGRRVADAFGKRRPEAKVLFMSGYALEMLDSSSVQIDEGDLLEKPFGPPQLLSAMEKLLG